MQSDLGNQVFASIDVGTGTTTRRTIDLGNISTPELGLLSPQRNEIAPRGLGRDAALIAYSERLRQSYRANERGIRDGMLKLGEAVRDGQTIAVSCFCRAGQICHADIVKNAIEKATSQGNERVMITERGTSFGYNNLVVDFRGLPIMRSFGFPVVYDVTHSLQRPGGLGTSTGGDSQFIEYMARAGVACGVDGVFMEVHDNPDAALSDGPNSLSLERLEPLLEKLMAIHKLVRE